jgi:hypothetical protein
VIERTIEVPVLYLGFGNFDQRASYCLLVVVDPDAFLELEQGLSLVPLEDREQTFVVLYLTAFAA